MTKLDKSVTRVARQTYKGIPIVVTLEPHGVVVVKRLRHKERWCVPFESLFEIAAKIAVIEERRTNPDLKLRTRR